MKKTLIALVLLGMTIMPVLIMAGETAPVIKKDKIIIVTKNTSDLEDMQELKGDMQELKGSLKELNGLNKTIQITMNDNPGDENPNAPFFGIIPADLDFPKAQELNLTQTYGVLITGIVPNSPAYQYRLVEDDVILEINGKKVLNLKEMDKIKALYRAGDAVTLTIFRAGETLNIDFVFGSREKKADNTAPDEDKPQKRKLSVGSGGGSWIPLWFDVDITDVNDLIGTGNSVTGIDGLGFEKLPEDGLLTQGLGGKGNIGKGWFLGGQIQWYEIDRKAADLDAANLPTGYTNHMIYDLTMGGVTLDKRFAITKNITTSLGLLIGGASHSVDLVHTNGNYDWEHIPGTVYDANNTKAKISRGYLIAQPRAELMVHFLSWLGLRAEAGYMYGYAPVNGWKVAHNEMENFEIKNSPNTPFEGYTISVGPWFGF